MKFSTEKRFIAGVICPKCSALDKLVAYAQDDTNYRECVRCGFKDEIRLSSPPHELKTRVNRSTNQKNNKVSAVKFVDFD